MTSAEVDQIKTQIIWNRLISVVEEQANAIIRGSFSPAVREAGDLAAGIFDTRGRMLAQAVTGTPGHVNSMAAAVPDFLDIFPVDTMAPGDAFITNDPWVASGHLHDFTIVTPAFYRGKVVGLFAATVHAVDVGGRGLGADGRQVYEEGICVPIMHLARAGEINRDLIRILCANSREPLLVEGDTVAIAGAGEEGVRRLEKMMDEFAITDLDTIGEHIITQSRNALGRVISNLPDGTYRHETTVDGYDEPVRLKAALTIGGERITVDYSGSAPASSYGINVVINYTSAYTVYGVKCLIAPDIPNNHGSIEPIAVHAPEGSILNAVRPSPVAARHVIGHVLPDLVLGCMDQAIAEGTPAESAMMWNPYFRGAHWFDDGRRDWEAFFFTSGGMGGRPGRDGLSATAFPAGVSSIPVEVAESVSPIVVWRKEFRAGSGGAGEYRGGLGQDVEIGGHGERGMIFSAMFDRVNNPASGHHGGGAGAPGVVKLKSGTKLRSKGMQDIPDRDRLILALPGGGGFGDPLKRDPQAVLDDVMDGLISRDDAAAIYGVIIGPEGRVDEVATARERSRLSKARNQDAE